MTKQTKTERQSVADLLIAARAKIASPSTWTQYVSARDADGNAVDARDDAAVCFCAYGAIGAVMSRVDADSIGVSLRASNLLYDYACTAGFAGAAHLNDQSDHAAVLEMYDSAIDAARMKVCQ
jgi:hypothetical protein